MESRKSKDLSIPPRPGSVAEAAGVLVEAHTLARDLTRIYVFIFGSGLTSALCTCPLQKLRVAISGHETIIQDQRRNSI